MPDDVSDLKIATTEQFNLLLEEREAQAKVGGGQLYLQEKDTLPFHLRSFSLCATFLPLPLLPLLLPLLQLLLVLVTLLL